MTDRRRRIASIALGGRGGSSIAAVELARALAREGHSVLLLAGAPIGRPTADEPRLSLERRCFGPLDRPDAPGRLLRELAAADVEAPLDEVHVHYLTPLLGWTLDALAELRGRPRLTAIAHGTDTTRRPLGPERVRARRRVDRWGVASPALTPHLRALGIRGRVECIPPGVDLERFRPLPATEGPPTVVQVTNFFPWKRSGAALAVLRELRRRGHDARLRWIGDGPARARLERRVRRMGLAGVVGFEGAIELDAEALAGVHAVLSTSAEESFGLSLAEAWACGRPVVAPLLPGPRWALGGLPGVQLVPRPTVARLADALERAFRAPAPQPTPTGLRRLDARRSARRLLGSGRAVPRGLHSRVG